MTDWTHSGFSGDASIHLPAGSSKTRKALARYIVRPPVSLKHPLLDEGGTDEEEMWRGERCLNFLEPETRKKSDNVMAYQIDGEVIARYHGREGIFRPDRVAKVLETVKRCNIALNPEVGAVNFARPDGTALGASSQVAAYGQCVVFPHEIILLAATYAYAGEKDYGLELVRKHWSVLVEKRGYSWDYPNIVDREGKRFNGTDYYMDMILWMYPAILEGRTLGEACAAGSLVSKVLEAGRGGGRTGDVVTGC